MPIKIRNEIVELIFGADGIVMSKNDDGYPIDSKMNAIKLKICKFPLLLNYINVLSIFYNRERGYTC